MSVLSDVSLRAYIEAGRIKIDPMAEGAVQPASIDIRLGPLLRIAELTAHRTHHLREDGPFTLSQFQFVLASTLEWIEVPNDLVAVIAGKSTLARQGLILENAGYVDPGWRGELTLELFALAPRPVVLTHCMLIGQIRFERLTTPAERPYGSDGLGSHYQRSHGPVLSAVTP